MDISNVKESGGPCVGSPDEQRCSLLDDLREAVKGLVSKSRKGFWLRAAMMAVVAVGSAFVGHDNLAVFSMAVGIALIVQALMQGRSLKEVDTLDADALVAKAKELHYEVVLGKKHYLRNAMLVAILFTVFMLFDDDSLSAKTIVSVLVGGTVFFLVIFFGLRKDARKPLDGADKRIADLLEQL